ncbi:hypothetical protein I308_104817 [Cryptococcus tetragattii IND107]|uniref:t-SNARE coiled-coil homology domain-containing protein n=1 Tax=Cryptococcus tetragattii IND107 TaxID=1296105 RepID=A0ABR3BNN0_9TREE
MSTPTPASISQRLTTTSSLLLERSRILSLNLKPSPSSTQQIVRNLTSIRSDLERLELESTGLVLGGKKGKTKGGDEGDEEVKQLEERYDRLLGMLEEDDLGREKAKDLKRTSQIPPSPIASPQPEKLSSPAEASPPAQDVPTFSIEPPTPAIGHQPFKDYPEDEEPELTPHEMLSNQQMLMNDQDERLNLLSHSIGRQNDLSLQIGSELDLHHQLLEETDTAMDRTAASLGRAKRRLDRVADEAKQHGSTITIVLLIFILLILIIVFKT